METIRIINFIITAIFAVCYAYQFAYVPLSLWFQNRDRRRLKNTKAEADNELCDRHLKRYAVLISARNEENVIGQLIDSINNQTYKGEEKESGRILPDFCATYRLRFSGSVKK